MSQSSQHYTLYGTDNSYFTGKVRAYLNYKGIPYRFRVATLWVYKRFIEPRTGVRFIPVLQTPEDQVVQDTTEIIEFLEQRFPQRPIQPATPQQKLVSLLLELYADEWFLFPAMHYRWSYLLQQEAEILEQFGRLGGAWLPRPMKVALGRRICGPFRNSLKPLGITPETIPALEHWFQEQFLPAFEAHLCEQDYLLGSRPCMADFALAGPLTAHLWQDPCPHDVLAEKAPNTVDWIRRINSHEQPEGAFLAGDEVPRTLYPILRHQFSEQWPILADTVSRLEDWLAEHPEKTRISRAIGWHDFRIGNASGKRLVFPYAQWMVQRPLEHYRALDSEDRQRVDALLQELDGTQAMQMEIRYPVKRDHNLLVPCTRPS